MTRGKAIDFYPPTAIFLEAIFWSKMTKIKLSLKTGVFGRFSAPFWPKAKNPVGGALPKNPQKPRRGKDFWPKTPKSRKKPSRGWDALKVHLETAMASHPQKAKNCRKTIFA